MSTDIHSCSYYCDRPECIKSQRDELRDKYIINQPERLIEKACEWRKLVPYTYETSCGRSLVYLDRPQYCRCGGKIMVKSGA